MKKLITLIFILGFICNSYAQFYAKVGGSHSETTSKMDIVNSSSETFYNDHIIVDTVMNWVYLNRIKDNRDTIGKEKLNKRDNFDFSFGYKFNKYFFVELLYSKQHKSQTINHINADIIYTSIRPLGDDYYQTTQYMDYCRYYDITYNSIFLKSGISYSFFNEKLNAKLNLGIGKNLNFDIYELSISKWVKHRIDDVDNYETVTNPQVTTRIGKDTSYYKYELSKNIPLLCEFELQYNANKYLGLFVNFGYKYNKIDSDIFYVYSSIDKIETEDYSHDIIDDNTFDLSSWYIGGGLVFNIDFGKNKNKDEALE